jgi:hypothetical protein
VAVERGNVKNPADYLQRIIRFQETGEWTLIHLDAEPSQHLPGYIGGGRLVPTNGGAVRRNARYE